MRFFQSIKENGSALFSCLHEQREKAGENIQLKRIAEKEEKLLRAAYTALGRQYYMHLPDLSGWDMKPYCDAVEQAVRRLRAVHTKMQRIAFPQAETRAAAFPRRALPEREEPDGAALSLLPDGENGETRVLVQEASGGLAEAAPEGNAGSFIHHAPHEIPGDMTEEKPSEEAAEKSAGMAPESADEKRPTEERSEAEAETEAKELAETVAEAEGEKACARIEPAPEGAKEEPDESNEEVARNFDLGIPW